MGRRRIHKGLGAATAALVLAGPVAGSGAEPAPPAPRAPTATAEWLAGDLHVHTCYSHDAYCGPGDDNTGLEELYTLSGDVGLRFAEAALKGLDYLAITDHNDVRSTTHPAFGAHGVVPVRGYEASLDGHAQVLGVGSVLDHDEGPGAAASLAAATEAAGGAFQINHPGAEVTEPVTGCGAEDLDQLDWGYGTAVVPDAVEVWNIGHHLQPPIPSGNSNDDSERFWECLLDAGHQVAATGGSDSHWLATTALQGIGSPTTWVLAEGRSEAAVIEAIKAGRTSMSMLPPLLGGAPLLLEADADGDGTYEATIGDTVAPGTPMQVRSAGGLAGGVVRVRANGATIVDAPLLPLGLGGPVRFTAPAGDGWVRASLYVLDGPAVLDPLCRLLDGTPLATTYCRNHLVVAGLTSPIYLR